MHNGCDKFNTPNRLILFDYLKLVKTNDQGHQKSSVMEVNTGTERIKNKGEPMNVDDVNKANIDMEISDSDSSIKLRLSSSTDQVTESDSEDNSSEIIPCFKQDIKDPAKTIVQHQVKGNEAKIVVILENGEQRLISFGVPEDDCTVADLLEQANIQASQEPRVSLVSDPTLHINYIVDVTAKTNYDESDRESSIESGSLVKSGRTALLTGSTGSNAKVAKYIKGMLAVCPFCGMSASDFNYCMRCKRKLPDDIKSIPISTGTMTKRDNSSSDHSRNKIQNFYSSFVKKQDSRSLQRAETISKRSRKGWVTDKQKDKMKKFHNNSIEMSKVEVPESKEKVKMINDVKSEIPNNLKSNFCVGFDGQVSGRGRDTDPVIPPTTNLLVTLKCRTVIIGSYKFFPDCEITITSDILLIQVPSLEDERKSISLKIKYGEMLALLIHFSKSMPVLFFYTNIPTGSRIRDILGMQDPKGPYYDPASKDQTHKRITLLPERITDDAKLTLKEIFRPIMSELNGKEANDILVKASPRAVQVPAPSLVKKPRRSTRTKKMKCSTCDKEKNKKKKKSHNNFIQMFKVQVLEPKEKAATINEKEPVITNTLKSNLPVDFDIPVSGTSNGKDADTVIPTTVNLLVTIKCNTVRIGSYRFIPDSEVTITSDYLLLKVPLLQDETHSISLKIHYEEMLALSINFSKSMPVLFLDTNLSTGLRIRDLLGMQNPKGPYFDPASKDQTHKRITILPEKITDKVELMLKEIFKPIMNELSWEQATNILFQAVL
ncbi:uncharacterized protein LOC106654253 isoform X2 [Trichogramma pretiosum]|uniref:uncharacterized protein LOC106654253 isoform X2 n=1 Tax=Trichogramma pretiosum TaxID=7493 RepID=UPI000C71968A|nr:uncharacterized protein LOC106654253 isoform X2 [Trichogramma pretiosum]